MREMGPPEDLTLPLSPPPAPCISKRLGRPQRGLALGALEAHSGHTGELDKSKEDSGVLHLPEIIRHQVGHVAHHFGPVHRDLPLHCPEESGDPL